MSLPCATGPASRTTGPDGAPSIPHSAPPRLLRALGLILGAYAFGGLIAMVQLMPSYELYLYGWRAGGGDVDLVRQWGCSLKDLAVNFLGRAQAEWKWEKAAFPGTLAWVATLYGLFAWRDRPARALLSLIGLGLLLSWSDGNPLYDLLAYVPVLNRFRAPGRIGVLIIVGAGLLLARLVDEVRERRPTGLAWAMLGTLGLLQGIALVTTGRLGYWPWSATDPLGPQLAALLAVAGLALAGTVRPGRWLPGMLLVAAAAEFLIHAQGINPAYTKQEWLQQPDQRIYALAADHARREGGAFVRWQDGLPNNVAIYYGVPQARGYTPMAYPAMDAMNTWLFGPNTPETLAAFGVRWVGAKADAAKRAGLKPVARAGEWLLCRSPLPAARAYIPAELLPGDTDQAMTVLRDPATDPRQTIVAPTRIIGDAPVSCPGGKATVTDNTPTRLTIRTSTSAPGLVVMTQLWTPQWSAFVDDRPAETLASNAILLSTTIPPGEHTVRFQYQAELLRPALVSGLMALLWMGWLGMELRRKAARPA